MRPPEFTGGNAFDAGQRPYPGGSFNEAAGIHRRKRAHLAARVTAGSGRFNEAAGIHRRKPTPSRAKPGQARRFNEAAGIHRRKLMYHGIGTCGAAKASMRPPEFTGGNCHDDPLLPDAVLLLQ